MWIRLRQICLVANELDPVVEDFRAVFGLEVCYNDPGVGRFGLENALLPIGNQFLEIVAPIEENTAGGRYLERRGGDGGYMFITQCDDHAPRRKRVEELGIRVVNQFERHGFQNMQLHPKDTGGTFFEIDCQTDGMELDGPWEPAGPDWKPAKRTDVVDGIVGAEIQSPNPEPLAARWAEIAELPLENRDGAPTLDFSGTLLRFVLPDDGRPEGLGALTLHAVDRERAMKAAAERDCLNRDGTIEICGTRFHLTG